MINQNLNPKRLKETTISRQARNAFVTAVVFSIASLINFAVSLQISIQTREIVSFIDSLAVLAFSISAMHASTLIRKGEKDRGVWQIIITLVVVLGIRTFVNSGLGYIFGILVSVLVPFVALLTLKQETFNRSLALGLVSAAGYLIFDILMEQYFPNLRQGGDDIALMARLVGTMAGLLAISYFYVLIRQSRFLLLSSKLTLGMTLVVIIPLVVLGISNTISLSLSLAPRDEQVIISRAAYLAENINAFLENTKSGILVESQAPSIRDYVAANQDSTSETFPRETALETLLSYKRKDILNIDSYALLDRDGINILDTETEKIGQNESRASYFSEPLISGTAYISDIQLDSGTDQRFFVFSAPIKSQTGKTIGVLRARYKANVLDLFFDRYSILTLDGASEENFAALIHEVPVEKTVENDPNYIYLILANTDDPLWNYKVANYVTTSIGTPLQMARLLPPGSTAQLSLRLHELEENLENRKPNSAFQAQAFPRDEEVNNATDLIAAVPLNEKPDWIVLAAQDLISLNVPVQNQRETTTIITVLIAMAAAILAFFTSQTLISPILALTKISQKVAQGDFTSRAKINTEDEIGTLGSAFNTMTAQLENLISTLEERVADRTDDLERRTLQLQAAVEVGKVAVSLRNLDNLLTQATELISLRFGFYHAGIFLLDEKNEYAVLRAANSEGGKRMLERHHQLKVGQVGIVGYVTETGQARIALDVGQDAIYFDNPDLPQTRSEMALALIAGGRVLGALDIQSTQGEAFSDADIDTLQVLADQIAISIENARLFEENNNNLQALRRAYGEQSRLGWQELVYARNQYGYRSKRDGSIVSIDEPTDSQSLRAIAENKVVLDETKSTASIPIIVRGHPIGMLRLAKPETARSWTESELELANVLSTELSGALDSARLFDETRKQAEQEYIVGEITDKMRESMNVESIIKMAADEIYKLLDLEHIAIHFTPEEDENKEDEGVA